MAMYGEVVRATSRVVIFLFLSVISEQRHSYRRFVFSVWPLIVSDFHFDFDILHKCFPLDSGDFLVAEIQVYNFPKGFHAHH